MELFEDNKKLFERLKEIIHKIEDNYDKMLELYIKMFENSRYRVDSLYLISKNQPAQRTIAWHRQRHTCVTASDISSALGNNKYKSARQVILEKCGHNKFTGNKYTMWGNRFEPVATMFYEHYRKVVIYEATLLIHPIYAFIGASCDGFVVDEKNKEGYLIEIKCPYTRMPSGIIPIHYWEQPQIQMEVSKIHKCIFLDCKFEEYQNEEDFFNDIDIVPARGVYLEYLDTIYNTLHYTYPEKIIEKTERKDLDSLVKKFEEEICHDHMRYIKKRFVFWKLSFFEEVTIMRDRQWFTKNLPKLRQFWKTVEHYREQGIENLKTVSILKE